MNKLLLLGLILVVSFGVAAQDVLSEEEVGQPTSCATNALSLDLVANELSKDQRPGEYLIIISRLGKNEVTFEWLHTRRLYTITKYLSARTNSGSHIIQAWGPPTSGSGKIEIYLKGRRYRTLIATQCADLPIAFCDDKEFDPQFYLGSGFRKNCR